MDKSLLKVTAGQIALLHVAKRDLCLDDEDYRSILRHYRVETAKDLNMKDFEQLMRYLESLGFKSANPRQPPYRRGRDPLGLPYPAQLAEISRMFRELGIPEGERQQGFCRKVIKKAWPQTREEANKVFEGLKAMIRRRDDMPGAGRGKGGSGRCIRRKRLKRG
jgi:hypothetical protein